MMALATATMALVALQSSQLIDARTALLVVSTVHIGLGLHVFLAHGGPVLTPTGLYYLAALFFVGVAGVYGARASQTSLDSMVKVSLAILLANLLLYHLRFRGGTNHLPQSIKPGPVAPASIRWSWRLGAALLAAGLGARFVAGEALDPIPEALAFVGAATLLGRAAISVAGGWHVITTALAAIAGLSLYLVIFFSGFGRLNVVVLVMGGFLIGNTLKSRAWHKPLLLVAILPAAVLAGAVELTRGTLGVTVSPREILTAGEGLTSGTGPLATFAELVALDDARQGGGFPRRYGMSMLEGLTAPIPREWWAGKPFGLGFLLTLHLLPQYASSGHSMAALAYGEWYIDYWWFGFVLFPFLLAAILRKLDAWQQRLVERGLISPSTLVALLCFAILAAGLLDYVWVGLFTFMAREGIRVAILLPILLLATPGRTGPRAWRSR